MRPKRLAAATALVLALTVSGIVTSAAPSAAAPTRDPVVVIGGMGGSSVLTAPGYLPLMGRLAADGYSVSLFTTPDAGLGDIHANAGRLASYIDGVLQSSGASKVDIVAHSQGGLIARDYIKFLGGSAKVDSLVTLGTPHYGTVLSNLANVFLINCVGFVGCSQQAVGSPYLAALNAGDDSIGAVRYTAFSSRLEQVVLPHTNAFLTASDGNIVNVRTQDQCGLRFVDHFAYILSGAVYDGIRDALRGEAVRMNCWAL